MDSPGYKIGKETRSRKDPYTICQSGQPQILQFRSIKRFETSATHASFQDDAVTTTTGPANPTPPRYTETYVRYFSATAVLEVYVSSSALLHI